MALPIHYFQSANYFADQNEDNCLLKDETRTTRGDVYIDAGPADGEVTYLEPCNTGAAAMSFNAMFAAVARNRKKKEESSYESFNSKLQVICLWPVSHGVLGALARIPKAVVCVFNFARGNAEKTSVEHARKFAVVDIIFSQLFLINLWSSKFKKQKLNLNTLILLHKSDHQFCPLRLNAKCFGNSQHRYSPLVKTLVASQSRVYCRLKDGYENKWNAHTSLTQNFKGQES